MLLSFGLSYRLALSGLDQRIIVRDGVNLVKLYFKIELERVKLGRIGLELLIDEENGLSGRFEQLFLNGLEDLKLLIDEGSQREVT